MNEQSTFSIGKKIGITIIFGIISLLLSPYGISAVVGVVEINIPWTLLLPIIVAMAWGWQYGTLGGLSGGALFPFVLWPNNGYANFSTTIIFISIYAITGLINNKTVTKTIQKLPIRIILALLLSIVLLTSDFVFLFNKLLALNPCFWQASTINHLPENLLYTFAIKDSFNIVVLTLISETILRIPLFRKLLGIRSLPAMKANLMVFMVTMATAIMIWLSFLSLDILLFTNNVLLDGHIELAFFLIITCGFFVARMLFQYNESQYQIQELLTKSDGKYKALYENANDAIFIIKNGLLNDCNTTTLNLFGGTEKEVLGKTPAYFSPLYQPDGQLSETKALNLIELAHSGTPQRFEWLHKRVDNTLFEVEVLLSRIDVNEEVLLLAILRDITERKTIEVALRNSEERYKTITSGLTDYLYTVNLNAGKAIETIHNEACLVVTGYTANEFSENPFLWYNMILEADRPLIASKITDILEGKTIEPIEHRICCKDGSIKWISDTTILKFDTNGTIVSYDGVISDITKRKLIEEKLKESELLFTEMAANVPGVIYQFYARKNGETGFYYLSPKVEEVLGMSTDLSAHEWNLGELVHPSDKASFFNAIGTAINEVKELNYEGRLITSLGTIWVQFLSRPLIKNDEIVFNGIMINITKRKLTEDNLRESEQKLSTLFAAMTEMVVLHEVVFNDAGEPINYRLTDCNSAFTKTLGIAKEDAVGKLATEVYQTPIAPYLSEFAQVGITGKTFEYISYFAPMDKHFMISVVSLGINRFATITNDITNIQLVQEAILAKNEELENFLYVTSHDLRSPLVNIQGFSQRLQKQTESINSIILNCNLINEEKLVLEKLVTEGIPKTLDFIFTNVTKMDTLINGLLQISRTGRIKMIIKKIDMNHLLKMISASFNFQISELQAKIMLNNIEDCYGDENLLNQLFSNLIGNAIKYRDKTRTLEIEISSKKSYNKIIYQIKDNGIGISAKHLEKIWDVFYRVDSTAPESGEGIGLSLVKRIVNKHRGKIYVESEVGIGTTFFIELQKNEFSE